MWDNGIYWAWDGLFFFILNVIFGPCLYFLSRDFLGVEAKGITSNTFTVVPNSWWRVFIPSIPSQWRVVYMLVLLQYPSISDTGREFRHQIVSFSANVYIVISLIFVWEFIYILDLLRSLYIEPTWLNTRLVAFTCLTSICLIHGTLLKLGLRLQNTLGALKLLVLALIPVSGFFLSCWCKRYPS